MTPELVGRSSSHYTRVARMVALELEVPHTFRPIFDLTSRDPATFAGNPALKMPILVDERGPLFGTENICRDLARRSARTDFIARGALADRAVANAEELVLHAMSADVAIVLAKLAGAAPSAKLVTSLELALDHLAAQLPAVLAALPPRGTSFFEVALYCAVRHVPFREVVDVASWPALAAFCDAFDARPSAAATTYRFDTP